MKKLITIAAVAIIGVLLAIVLIPDNKPAPAFSLSDLQGKPVSNANLQGKVSFINFWFPSCPGCVSEMPKVIKMSKDYQGKDFQVLGIAQPIDSLESVNQYVKEYGLPFTVMFDADKAAAFPSEDAGWEVVPFGKALFAIAAGQFQAAPNGVEVALAARGLCGAPAQSLHGALAL